MTQVPVIVLLSGGIDSSALIHFFQNQLADVIAVHLDYGQPSGVREQAAAEAIAKHFSVPLLTIPFGFRVSEVNGEFSFRNALFLFAVCAHMPPGGKRVALGIHSGTPYYDCSPAFATQVQALLEGYTGGTVMLEVPFLHWTKQEIYRYCRLNRIPVDLTYSCERSNITPCGYCPSCLDRRHLHED